jgi:hypothetical protein
MADSPYRTAQLRARRLQGRLERAAALEVQKALNSYARFLSDYLRTLPPSLDTRALEGSLDATRAAARRLDAEMAAAVRSNRLTSFNGTLEAWRASQGVVAASRGVSAASLGAIRVAPVSLLGQYATLSGGTHWRTLIRINAIQAAQEANEILLAAAQEGVGPNELARRLRKYVQGSETFQEAFTDVPTLSGDVAKIDLRRIPVAQRNATRQMVNNSRRIAVSEVHNARAEAETQHMINDPFVAAVRWELSPNRTTSPDSTFVPPDECDFLATQDLFGLGPGVYPVDKVPPPPHPYDRCEKMPITRPTSKIGQSKPKGSNPKKSDIDSAPGPAGTSGLTPAAEERMRQQAWDAVSFGIKAAP